MSRFSLIATIVPLVIVAIGLVGWVLTLRSDVTTTVQQIDGFHAELSSAHERIDNGVVLVGDTARGVNVRIDNELDNVYGTIDSLREGIAELETALAVASDQMRTIMGDHEIFKEALQELGESGALPSGERRAYGGYGN